MLGHSLEISNIARTRRQSGPPTPPSSNFPQTAFAFWEGQGQSNMTGFNEVGDAPASLRVMNPNIDMLTAAGAWRPYGLLASGESESFDGVLYQGKLDETETPDAAGGAGPLVGLHEAITEGAMQDPGGFVAEKLLMAKFSDAGKPLDAFLPDFDDGSAPLGGANFNARGALLPGAMRARLAAGETIFHQGKIWLQGETDAALARAAADVDHPALANYAAGVGRIRAFDREQFGTPMMPWYMVAIAEADVYDAAVNDALASLCRWQVTPGGMINDLGAGRDATSYIIDHMISPVGDVHFNMTQMRAIGAMVWEAHLHHAGQFGATIAHPVSAIRPVWQSAPAVAAVGVDEATVEAVANEDGSIHALALSAGSPPPDPALIVAAGESAAGERGRLAAVMVSGLTAETDYDVWTVYQALSGDLSAPAAVAVTTEEEAAPPPPPAGWSPADAAPLCWWDAKDAASVAEDAGFVTGWSDKSGGGATLAATAPAQRPVLNAAGLNGLPALDFDGDMDLETTGAGLAADMCLIVVAEVDDVTNGSEAILEFKTQNLAIRAQNNSEFRARFELMNGVNTNMSPTPVVNYEGAPHLFVGRYDSAADTVEIWIDGEMVASKSTYTIDISGPGDLRVMRPWGTALKLDGKVGEIVAIGSSAPADRERLEGYAAHRWGLAGLLPAGHPWKSSAP